MSFLFQKEESFQQRGYGVQDEATPTFMENFRAAAENAEFSGVSISKGNAYSTVLQPLIDEMNSRAVGETFINPGTSFKYMVMEPEEQERAFEGSFAEIESALSRYPEFSELQGLMTIDSVRDQAKQLTLDARQEYLKTTNDSPSGTASLARFAGEAKEYIQDPVLVSSMLFGGAKKLWGMALQEAILGAGSEALAQIPVQRWHQETGMEYTNEQYWNAVKYGAAFGFASPFAFRGAGKAISLTAQQTKEGYLALKKAMGGAPDSARVAEDVANELEEIAADNPLERSIAAETEHEQRLLAARASLDSNEPAPIPDQPASPIAPPKNITDYENINNSGVMEFDPDDLQSDPKTFQFKSGGDEFGVTDAYRGVTVWDQMSSGTVVVWERADGVRFIADGHQRLGMAKRIKKADPSQDPKLIGYLLREVDGVSAEDAMVKAAMKNTVEGSPEIKDVAKILRVYGDFTPGALSPTSVVVRYSRDIVRLSQETFGMFINDVISARDAATVGRLIPDDEEMQLAAVKVLAKIQPDNAFQAESIVRQVMEVGVDRRAEQTLFGDELIVDSLFEERARILDKTQKRLKNDKAAFKTLLDKSQRLEEEGNKLAQDANQRRVKNDSEAISLLQAVANRRGPISDALSEAARSAKQSGSDREAVDSFLEAVRRGIADGSFDGQTAGDVGRSLDVAAQDSKVPDVLKKDVEEFDDPNGPGAQRQADQLETDLFNEEQAIGRAPPEEPAVTRQEGFQEDQELLDDFNRLLNQDPRPSEDVLFTHPAAVKAVEASDSIPRTNEAPGYGSDDWRNTREFTFDNGETKIVGYDDAIRRFFKDAQTLAYRELGLPPEPVATDGLAVILLGPPAAGKSTLANPIAARLKAAIPDSDEIKKTLPEFDGGIGAAAVHAESSAMAKEMVAAALPTKTNMVIPKVGEDAASIKKLHKQLKDAGYKIILMDMGVTYENALVRMFRRFVSKGRMIGKSYMQSIGDRPTQTYYSLKEEGLFDGYVAIDNNGGRDVGPRIIEDQSGRPEIKQVIDQLQLESSGARGRGADGEPSAISRADQPADQADPTGPRAEPEYADLTTPELIASWTIDQTKVNRAEVAARIKDDPEALARSNKALDDLGYGDTVPMYRIIPLKEGAELAPENLISATLDPKKVTQNLEFMTFGKTDPFNPRNYRLVRYDVPRAKISAYLPAFADDITENVNQAVKSKGIGQDEIAGMKTVDDPAKHSTDLIKLQDEIIADVSGLQPRVLSQAADLPGAGTPIDMMSGFGRLPKAIAKGDFDPDEFFTGGTTILNPRDYGGFGEQFNAAERAARKTIVEEYQQFFSDPVRVAKQSLDQEEFAIGLRVDENQEVVPDTMTRGEMLEEIRQDKAWLDRLRGCVQ